ncbi:DUF3159 domain-containing protein [Streptomyces sp. SID5785]|uniref:DUF3159 domain-containing protein n=1 Tax=Streptomyces sp. SID5785 TaxID=2690309 RepID=UPI0013611ACE|nr:DUF3159 domain-containing protein [Streptomyces sp. SID5785]MZD07954.1 DUF3159 domain-containing protein [Streptomyces sp. SID5785]
MKPAAATAREDTTRQAVRAAWRSMRRSGAVAPELPAIVFVAAASGTGFWWGLGTGVLTVAVVLASRIRRRLSMRPVIGGTIGLAVAATIAHQTGSAANSLLTDIIIDLSIAAALAVSLAVRRPLVGVVWSVARREPLLWRTDPSARRAYDLATALGATALAVRALALAVVYLNDEPVAWLLTVKITLGLPVTLVVLAAAYAAGLHDERHREPSA